MKIFTAQQIRDGDAYTIRHEPVKSLDLMERAARSCAAWIKEHFSNSRPVYIFCGTGNNGGDGLALARLLREAATPDGRGYEVHTYIVFYTEKFSPDCLANRTRLEHAFGSYLHAVRAEADFPVIPAEAVMIDALFGTGLNRPLKGLAASAVRWMNALGLPVVSIDMPSGMTADSPSAENTVVKAAHTLSFEGYKLAFFMPENGGLTGQVHPLPIGIHPGFKTETATPYYLTDGDYIRSLYKKRGVFSHKGTYGHALLIAGSYGKMGAAVLAARACLRSGAGLVTCIVPTCGDIIMQTAVPEAMCLPAGPGKHWSEAPAHAGIYDATGVGPGIGRHEDTVRALEQVLSAVGAKKDARTVIDADALNIIGENNNLWEKIPPEAILTPHPKEFERLFGKTKNSFDRLSVQLQKSREYNIYILLKGHFTCITSPGGQVFFNATGNPGMATAGSGDTLTGVITGLLAAGYPPLHAAVFGAWLHGMAGDSAAAKKSQEAMIASDIIDSLGDVFAGLAAGRT